jgi:hypothetical protein
MLIKFLRKRKENKVAAQLEAERQTRQVLLNSLTKSVDRKVFHRSLDATPGHRNPVVPTTVSRDFAETLLRLGADEKTMDDFLPIVRD